MITKPDLRNPAPAILSASIAEFGSGLTNLRCISISLKVRGFRMFGRYPRVLMARTRLVCTTADNGHKDR